MRHHRLGHTDLEVSEICLGTMTYGKQNSAAEAYAQLDHALAAGVNFIDTAEMYAVPPRPDTFGSSESIIGRWLSERPGQRQNIVLASKVCGPAARMHYVRDGTNRLDRRNIESAIEASLRRLRTDYLDLYQLHWPDRATNYFGKLGYEHVPQTDTIPIAETLAVLEDLRKTGKIRHYGLSNETPWGVMQFLRAAETSAAARPVSIQNPYSLLNRSFEVGLAEVAQREQVGLLAYSPLAFGLLSGKYADGATPATGRLTLFPDFTRYNSPQARAAADRYIALARVHGLSPAQMALAFVRRRGFVTSTIIGATTLAQLQENLESVRVELSADVLAGIEAQHQIQPNPAP